MRETGKGGLTELVGDYLPWIQSSEAIYFVRNHQTLGSTKGRPDFELIIPLRGSLIGQFIGIELKGSNWKGKLDKYKQRQRELIERAGGKYFICLSLEELHCILQNHGIASRIELSDFTD